MSLLDLPTPPIVTLGDGIALLPRRASDEVLIAARAVIAAAPPRRMATPWGKQMSVAMTNCGALGWVSDATGYRYAPLDPISGLAWPALPDCFRLFAAEAAALAGFADFAPEACLVNCYEPAARMGLHQDRDEQDLTQPIVSVSLGMAASFRIGGVRRADPTRSITLHHGDVLVFGGPARLMFHGVDRLVGAPHPVLGTARINLTCRRITASGARSGAGVSA
jgi:alkylated DNA repair protein (DNA oxidative demethylase)